MGHRLVFELKQAYTSRDGLCSFAAFYLGFSVQPGLQLLLLLLCSSLIPCKVAWPLSCTSHDDHGENYMCKGWFKLENQEDEFYVQNYFSVR